MQCSTSGLQECQSAQAKGLLHKEPNAVLVYSHGLLHNGKRIS
jgi:hypothetical protein